MKEKPFLCLECNKGFKSIKQLRNHKVSKLINLMLCTPYKVEKLMTYELLCLCINCILIFHSHVHISKLTQFSNILNNFEV